MTAQAYAAAARPSTCPVCHKRITADRKMSWLRRFLYTNLNLFPHAVWIAGYIGHRSCLDGLVLSLRSVGTSRRRPGS